MVPHKPRLPMSSVSAKDRDTPPLLRLVRSEKYKIWGTPTFVDEADTRLTWDTPESRNITDMEHLESSPSTIRLHDSTRGHPRLPWTGDSYLCDAYNDTHGSRGTSALESKIVGVLDLEVHRRGSAPVADQTTRKSSFDSYGCPSKFSLQ